MTPMKTETVLVLLMLLAFFAALSAGTLLAILDDVHAIAERIERLK